jgi:hypothetical protein
MAVVTATVRRASLSISRCLSRSLSLSLHAKAFYQIFALPNICRQTTIMNWPAYATLNEHTRHTTCTPIAPHTAGKTSEVEYKRLMKEMELYGSGSLRPQTLEA